MTSKAAAVAKSPSGRRLNEYTIYENEVFQTDASDLSANGSYSYEVGEDDVFGSEEDDDDDIFNDENAEPEVPFFFALFVMISYIFGGAVIFKQFESWNMITSTYFVFITFSTIVSLTIRFFTIYVKCIKIRISNNTRWMSMWRCGRVVKALDC